MKVASISNAVKYLLQMHEQASRSKFVNKPISYALHKTWWYFDSIEQSRNATD